MSSKIPPLLQSYLALPSESSLILLTGVLGAGTNWLVLRYLCSLLQLQRGTRARTAGGAELVDGELVDREGRGEDVGVVVLSFMRDWAFWREGGAKLALDLDSLVRAGRFSFIDGLTGLYCKDSSSTASTSASATQGRRVLKKDGLDDVRKEIGSALGDLRARKKIVIVDGVDELLAMSGDEGMSSLAVENMLLSVREHVHATILTLAADSPLLHSQTTTLERSHAALLVSQAHIADQVISLRMLDTGVARDVSGVMRITVRADGSGEKEEEGGVEYLYHVGGDGGVRVFERGA